MSENTEILYQQALKLAHNNKAVEAAFLCEILLKKTKVNPVYWLLYISILEYLGRSNEVETQLNKAIKYLPLQPQFYLKLGGIKQNKCDYLAAEIYYKRAIELNNDFPEAIHELATIYKITSRFKEAIDLYNRCLKLRPEYPAALYNLAMVYYELGCPDRALPLFNACLELSPNSLLAMSGKATVLERLGQIDESHAILMECIKTPNSIPVASAYSLVASHFNDLTNDAIAYVSRALDETNPSKQDAALLYFLLGKMYEKSKNYDKSFLCFKRGNYELSNSFDIDAHNNTINNIKKIFAAGKSFPKSGDCRTKNIFIVGMPRSGTSLVEQILDSHSECHGAGELTFISDIANNSHEFVSNDLVYPDIVPLLDEVNIKELSRLYSSRLNVLDSDSSVVIDKMPANFLYLGLIEILFPEAKILHCTRNPMDNCLSCFFTNFGERLAYTNNLEILGEYYKSYANLMDFWKSHLDISILDVNYEDLVANQEAVSREILDFCDLDWDPECLNYFENDRIVRTASYDQVRKPIYTKSIGRWKRYKDHFGDLYTELKPFMS